MAWPEKRYKDRVHCSSGNICMLASYKKKKRKIELLLHIQV